MSLKFGYLENPPPANIAEMIKNFREFTGTMYRDDQIRAHLEFCNYLYENSIERFFENGSLLGQSNVPQMLGPV